MPDADDGTCGGGDHESVIDILGVDRMDKTYQRVGRAWIGFCNHRRGVLDTLVVHGEVSPLVGAVEDDAVGVHRTQVGVAALIGVAVDVNG